MRLPHSLFAWLLSGFLLAGCSTQQSKPLVQPAHESLITDAKVETTIVKEEQITEEMTCQGKIVSQGRKIISASIAGQITMLGIKAGSRIRAGQLLFQLDTTFLTMNLKEARLELELAREKLEDKISARPDRDSLSADLMDRWRLAYGIPQASHKIRRIRRELAEARGFAASGGKIGRVYISEGQTVGQGEKIAEYYPADSYEAELLLPILPSSLHPGQEVEVILHSGQTSISGKVREVLPMVNEQGMFVVYVSLPSNTRSLVHGQGITASILNRSEETVPTVPASALTTRSGKPVLFRVKQGMADWHYVTLGHRLGDKVQILEGIDVGDTVVTAGQQYLAHESQILSLTP